MQLATTLWIYVESQRFHTGANALLGVDGTGQLAELGVGVDGSQEDGLVLKEQAKHMPATKEGKGREKNMLDSFFFLPWP